MSESTFAACWDSAVADHGNQAFLIFRRDGRDDVSFTYAQFDAILAEVALTLRAHGVTAGSGIHMCLRNCPAFVAVWLAAATLGAWIIPVDPSSSPRDLGRQTKRTRPVLGIVGTERDADYRAAVVDAMPVITVEETAEDVAPGGPLRNGTTGSAVVWAPADDSATDASVTPRPEDRLAVMFTSGTTSEPKGVVLTQANYAYIADTMAELAGLAPEHRWFVTLPLFHGNAQYYCFSAAIAVGASVALTHAFSASRWADQAAELAATHASLFAAPIRMILSRTDPEHPPLSLTHVWYAQNLSAGHHAQFARLCGTLPRQLYGMTETTAIVCCDLSDRPRHDTIGRRVPGRRIALLSLVSHERAAVGEPGLLLLAGRRGLDLFEGYLDNPEANAKAFVTVEGEEWFATGDLVAEDAEGLLSFVGRADDVIKVSGENVSLTEVEAALAEAPGVLEVAVVARPDEIRDVVPVAFIVADDAAAPPQIDDLERFAAANLPSAARPRAWEIVDGLPKTSVGKIRRFQLDPTNPGSGSRGNSAPGADR